MDTSLDEKVKQARLRGVPEEAIQRRLQEIGVDKQPSQSAMFKNQNTLPNVSRLIPKPVREVAKGYVADPTKFTEAQQKGGSYELGFNLANALPPTPDDAVMMAGKGLIAGTMKFAPKVDDVVKGIAKSAPKVDDLAKKVVSARKRGVPEEAIQKRLAEIADPLTQQARKYKSAEEFVNSTKRLFHSTSDESAKSIEKMGFKPAVGERSLGTTKGKGVFFYDTIGPTAEFGKNFTRAGKTPSVVEASVNGKIFNSRSQYKSINALAEDAGLIKKLKDGGYVGIRGEEMGEPVVFIFDPSAVKTKSQLTDIWNKANKAESEIPNIDQRSYLREGFELKSNGDIQDVVAREKFDFSNMNRLSGGGSDRDVFDLNDRVLKVAKTSRGLTQNTGADYYAEDAGLIPTILEKGENYVIFEKVEKPNDVTKKMVNELKKLDMYALNSRESKNHYDEMNKAVEIMEKYEYPASSLLDYGDDSILWNDLASIRNWGTKDGKPILVDEGSFAPGVKKEISDSLRGDKTKNLDDPEFRDIYYKSRSEKKKHRDTDPYTMFAAAPFLLMNEEIKKKVEDARRRGVPEEAIQRRLKELNP